MFDRRCVEKGIYYYSGTSGNIVTDGNLNKKALSAPSLSKGRLIGHEKALYLVYAIAKSG